MSGCDICGSRASWRSQGFFYCIKHAPIAPATDGKGEEGEEGEEAIPDSGPTLLEVEPRTPAPEEPSSRELELLRLRAQGMTLKEVAIAMGVATSTVKNYSYDLKQRLGADNLTQALLVALRRGYLTLDELETE